MPIRRRSWAATRRSYWGLLRKLLPQPVGALSQHLQPVQTLASSDVESPLIRPRKRYVRRLARHFDRAQIFPGAVDDLDSSHRGDVNPVFAVESQSVSAALLARWDVVQLRERALVFDFAVGLH